MEEALKHRQAARATRLSHAVRVTQHSLLRRILRAATVRVNSSHHQSVRDVAPSLVASAVAPDGIVEAIESRQHHFFSGCSGIRSFSSIGIGPIGDCLKRSCVLRNGAR